MLENVWAYSFLWHGKNMIVLSRRFLSDFQHLHNVVITGWEIYRIYTDEDTGETVYEVYSDEDGSDNYDNDCGFDPFLGCYTDDV